MTDALPPDAAAPGADAVPDPVLLEVEHETAYAYASPVELAQHLAFLKPREDAGLQDLRGHHLRIEPPPDQRSASLDAWGNPRCHFALARPHGWLRVRAWSRVAVHAGAGCAPADSLPWEAAAEAGRYRAPAPAPAPALADAAAPPGPDAVPASPVAVPGPGPDLALAARYASPLLPPQVLRDAALRDYARASFPPGRPVHAAALDLMHRVHADFRYAPAATEVHTPVLEAFARREGVCQDFAHLMIGALRGLGLSARYVSGYLLTEPPPGQERLQGADASHAWLAVACPQADGSSVWLELDPTNDCLAGTAHVRVATGRDYSEVTPLRGVIRGGGSHTLSVRVSTRLVESA